MKQRIRHGHRLPTEYFYVLIVQQDIVVLAYIYPSFVRRISIPAGDGFNFGKSSSLKSQFKNDLDLFSAMQVGGNANAVSKFCIFDR